MFTMQLLRLGSGRYMLVCHFPPHLLEPFKAAVPESERTWHQRLRWWEVTVAGFLALDYREPKRIAPLAREVADYVYPWPSG